MKWFGSKAGGRTPRPPLARAWGAATWSGLGDWPQGYDAQLRAAVLANPVAQHALRLVSEAAGSAALRATAARAEDAAAGLALVQRRAAGQGLVETLAEPPPFPVTPGALALLTQGCDKRLATCAERFGNAVNFRGEPFLPGIDLLTRYPGA